MILSRLRAVAVSLLALPFMASQAQTGGLDAPKAVGPYFNEVFPPGSPGDASGWTTKNAFPNLTFVDPLWMAEIPGGSGFLLAGKNGQLWRFANDSAVLQSDVVQVLDWRDQTQTSEDQGFYSFAFHPQFGQAGSANANYIYVCYSHKPALAGTGPYRSYWRVSRFTWLPGTGKLDPASEFVFINQFDADLWHNGGAMFFDNQGFLNISCGDGGNSGGSRPAHAPQQIKTGLVGGILRIDIDNNPTKSHPIRRQPVDTYHRPTAWPTSSTQGYGIPNDNPWLDVSGTILEEFAVIGLRSPHTAHYDRVTEDIWVGDVGENTREELNRLTKGGNAQWSYLEGTVRGPGYSKPVGSAFVGVEQIPVYDYGRTMGGCVIGGMRYRGSKWAELLGGKVLFGDHLKGRIWSATLVPESAPVIEELVGSFAIGNKRGLVNFCSDSAGEVYLMTVAGTNLPGGTIRKLVQPGISPQPPTLLSQTGVFTNLFTLAIAPGFVPYDVGSPLWSDGAEKRRWIAVPNEGSHTSMDQKIIFSENGNWLFPAGSVLVKHFEMPLDERHPSVMKRLETRFLICTEKGGKYGITYRWNEAGTDAQLLSAGEHVDFEVTDANGTTRLRRWDFPSRSDCLLCHTSISGQALGLRTHQLNKDYHYPSTGRTANQLATFNELKMFERTLTAAEIANFIQSRPLEDESAPLEHRVRSYLDSNCSHCHQPFGPVDSFDARLATPLNLQGLVDGMIKGHFEMGPDARYMKPGSPQLSAIHLRTSHAGDGIAMPPLGKNLVDQRAVSRLEEYLTRLVPSEFQLDSALSGRYVRLTALSGIYQHYPAPNHLASVAEFSVLDGLGSSIPLSSFSVVDFDSEETVDAPGAAIHAIDGDPSTYWHSAFGVGGIDTFPHHLTLDLGSSRSLGGFLLSHRQDEEFVGRINGYQIHSSTDLTNWTLAASGNFPNTKDLHLREFASAVRKARCEIAAPRTPGGPFEVTVVFDMNVTDFTASDLAVSGGVVTGLRGKGYYYVASVVPSQKLVAVSVVENAVNPKGVGSRASNPLALVVEDVLPPRPRFPNIPSSVAGPFQISLTFDEIVTGLDSRDFVITNGTLDAIAPEGIGYLLTLFPSGSGPVGISLRSGGVKDVGGNGNSAGDAISVPYQRWVWAREAEEGVLSGGFKKVNDPTASGGAYIWVPSGSRSGATAYDPALKAGYQFFVPSAGSYEYRVFVRLPGGSGNLYVKPGSTGSPVAWNLAANPNFYEPFSPGTRYLEAGANLVEIFGGSEGVHFDRIEMKPLRPQVTLSGPRSAPVGDFDVNVVFSEWMRSVSLAGFSISGGTVHSLRGQGTNYTVTVSPSAPVVTLSMRRDVVLGFESDKYNDASDLLIVICRNTYDDWAFYGGVDNAAEFRMADEDGDGLEKVLEFAFNLDPSKNDHRIMDLVTSPAAGLPRLADAAAGNASLQFLRRKNVPGLTYVPQFGSTLGDFVPAAATEQVENIDADWERVTVQDTAAPAGAKTRFGRVKVIMTP